MAEVEGSSLVAQSIHREGIETLFGLAGGPIQDIMGFAPHFGIRPIGVRHEQAATFAAAAYGYVKNQVGVAVLAAGPAVTNGMTGAHVAYDNCLPLVILGGSGPQKGRYTGTFQETENVPMFKGITKMSVQVDSTARIPEYMAMAFRKARTGRPGPVYLDLPSDVLQNGVDEDSISWPSNYYADAPPLGNPGQVKRAAELLLNAERPMMIVGKGVRWSEPTAELRQLVESVGMPYIASPMGRGFIPDDHPLNFGAARSAIMGNADVVVVVGSRLNWMFGFGRQFPTDAKVIHIDIEPEEIGFKPGRGGGDCRRRQDCASAAPGRAGREDGRHGGTGRGRPMAVGTAGPGGAQRSRSSVATFISDDKPIRTHRLLARSERSLPQGNYLHRGWADHPGHGPPGAAELHAGQPPKLRHQRLAWVWAYPSP